MCILKSDQRKENIFPLPNCSLFYDCTQENIGCKCKGEEPIMHHWKTKVHSSSNSWKQKAFKLPRLPSIKLIVPLNFAQKLCKWLIRLDKIIMKNVPKGQIFWKLKQSRLEPGMVVPTLYPEQFYWTHGDKWVHLFYWGNETNLRAMWNDFPI